MSQKITSKNLSYDTTLPPFLARLHGRHQQQLSSDAPDPILTARRRPGARVRSASEEAEDAPLVVDEQGNVVQLEAGEEVLEDGDVVRKGNDGGDDEGKGGKESKDKEKAEKEKERFAAIGAGKKRKAGRVVGGGGGSEDEADEKSSSSGPGKNTNNKAKKSIATTTEADTKPTVATTANPPPKKKAKKKAKIQLSFGDDDGE